jgi:hypothetical protein
MAGQYIRLMDTRVLGPNLICPREQVADLGAYTTLEIDPRVLVTGAGNLIVETASVNEEGAFRTIATIALTATSGIIQITSFLRYVRWRTDANVTGTPTVVLDVMAKGG